MGARKVLAATTVVHKNGQPHTFDAGTVPPEWATRLIKNEMAWTEIDDVDYGDADESAKLKALRKELVDAKKALAEAIEQRDALVDEVAELREQLASVEVQSGETQGDTTPPDEPESPDEPAAEVADIPVPPKSGTGSGATAWRTYAKARGYEVEADASRDDIIAALADAGVPVE